MTPRDVLQRFPPPRGNEPDDGAAPEVPLRDELDSMVQAEFAGRFRIGPLLRRGARSSVYDAHEIEGGRRVALRVMSRASLAGNGLDAAIERAIAAAASLDHPNAVPIHAFGATARLRWYAMEFVEGRSLAALLEEVGQLDLKRCLRMAEQTAAALHFAHRRGVVHGDVRPNNLFVLGPGWVHLSDFVVTRVLNGPSASAAPEDTGPGEPGPAADQYGLAVTLHECLAGAPPSPGDARVAGLRDYPLPSRLAEARPELPGHVFDALQRALSPRPAHRFPTVLEFVSALSAAEVGPPVTPPEAPLRPAFFGPELLFVEPTPARPRRSKPWRAIVIVLALVGAGEFGLEQMKAAVPALPLPGAAAVSPAPPPAPVPAPAPAPAPAETRVAPVVSPRLPQQGPDIRARAKPSAARLGSRRSTQPAPGVQAARAPARLTVSSTPWGLLYVDERLVGNTPIVDLPVTPGPHRLRITRDGYRPLTRRIRIGPTERSRSLNLVLAAGAP